MRTLSDRNAHSRCRGARFFRSISSRAYISWEICPWAPTPVDRGKKSWKYLMLRSDLDSMERRNTNRSTSTGRVRAQARATIFQPHRIASTSSSLATATTPSAIARGNTSAIKSKAVDNTLQSHSGASTLAKHQTGESVSERAFGASGPCGDKLPGP